MRVLHTKEKMDLDYTPPNRTDKGSGTRHLSAPLAAVAAAVMGPEWRVINQLLQNWEQIVGKDSARHATPVGVKLISSPANFMRDRAKIIIRIPGALAPQFQMKENTLIQRINRLMGHDFVEKIVWEHKIEG